MSAAARREDLDGSVRILLIAAMLACAESACAESSAPGPAPAPAPREEAPPVVSVRENWTDATLRIVRFAPSERPGFVALRVEIEALREVPGFLSLPDAAVGKEVTLYLRQARLDEAWLREQKRIEARVRRGRDPEVLFADERTVRAADDDDPQ